MRVGGAASAPLEAVTRRVSARVISPPTVAVSGDRAVGAHARWATYARSRDALRDRRPYARAPHDERDHDPPGPPACGARLLRSQALELLLQQVRAGELADKEPSRST